MEHKRNSLLQIHLYEGVRCLLELSYKQGCTKISMEIDPLPMAISSSTLPIRITSAHLPDPQYRCTIKPTFANSQFWNDIYLGVTCADLFCC